MNFQPQILIPPPAEDIALRAVLAASLQVPERNVFDGATPDDADFARLFAEGYAVLHRYMRGSFAWMIDGMMDDAVMDAVSLQALSARLGVAICVDHSQSKAHPRHVAYTPAQVVEGISAEEREDGEGEPYLTSRQFEAMGKSTI